MTTLAKSIYHTVVFFAAQGVPLTLMEIYSYLISTDRPRDAAADSLSKIKQTLDEELSGLIVEEGGWYVLPGKHELPDMRLKNYRISLIRYQKARIAMKGLRYIPFLRAVAISGSQALLTSGETSDIDLFVITKHNRIWLARVLISLYFQILGQRRHGLRIAGRFCLNHYLCEDTVISADRNLYTAAEYASLVPILGYEVLLRFWQQNDWVKTYFPRFEPELPSPFLVRKFSRFQKYIEWVLERTVSGPLNRILGRYQKQRVRMQDYILVSDQELSFHPGSRGQRVLRNYQESLK